MGSHFGKDFDRVIRWAKGFTGFRVRTVDGLPDFARVRDDWYGNRLIKIDRHQEYDSAVDCLIHEVSHLLDWDANGYVEDEIEQHRRSWGRIYSDLYRAYHKAQKRGEL